MSIQNSDADLKRAQNPSYANADTHGNLTVASPVIISIPTNVQFDLNGMLASPLAVSLTGVESINTVSGDSDINASYNGSIVQTSSSPFNLAALRYLIGGNASTFYSSQTYSNGGYASLTYQDGTSTIPIIHMDAGAPSSDMNAAGGNASLNYTGTASTLNMASLTRMTAPNSPCFLTPGVPTLYIATSTLLSLNLSGLASILNYNNTFGPTNQSGFTISCPALTSITWNSSPTILDFTTLSVNGCALPQSQVDAFLLFCLTGYTNGGSSFSSATVDCSGGTNASPSATGAGYVTSLQALGVTVTTN